ncbi:MAG: fructose-6-phosphate aldolase [Acidobacteria bacterium]|nr:MAG: fructose-6-phosphate aldolase [Acidobacteriota bacterium]
MKLFLDTGDAESIRTAQLTGLLDGVTTNPSLIARTGRDFREVAAEICRLVPGPVSIEAMADNAEAMVAEAEDIRGLGPNVVVKIPMTAQGLKAVPVLERDRKIKTNVTMIFSATQAFLAMKAGASYISIVLSRLDAVGNDSGALISDTMLIKANYRFTSQVIAGSVKTQNHVLHCLRAGVDVATVPEALFFQLFEHPLTEKGLEGFRSDWNRSRATAAGVVG